jgi:hemolysin III
MDLAEKLHLPPKWTQSFSEELANTISHTLGLIAAVLGTPFLLSVAWGKSDPAYFIGSLIFVATVLILYFGSALYHLWPQTSAKRILQVIDHGAVFLLIAGTCTPFALGPLRGPLGWIILAIIWTLAIFGIIMKTARGPHRHTKLAMCLYLGMGWSMLTVIRPLAQQVPPATLLWLVGGGIIYTAGLIFFMNERVRYFHFIWHLFVLAGTACHFIAVFSCAANA